MKSTIPVIKPDDQPGSGFNIIPTIILIILITTFLGAQVYLFMETIFEW